MNLYPYQQRARDRARVEYSQGKRALLYVAPTGAGKTCILSDTALAHLKHNENASIILYAHRTELLDQAAKTFAAFGLPIGDRVRVRSTQGTLAAKQVEACSMAIFDEAHHYAADGYRTIFDAHKGSGAIIVGATATPERGDGKPLDMFDSLVVVAQVPELVEEWRQDNTRGLVPLVDIRRPRRRLKSGQLAQSPVDAFLSHASDRKTVVFAPHVKAAEKFVAEFTDAGVRAEIVHGEMNADDRAAALELFRQGVVRVLVNVNVLTEGWDCPSCDCIIIARGMGSVGMYIQACGRAARANGARKQNYLVIDLTGVSWELGRPDDVRKFSLDGEGISKGTEAIKSEERLCKVCQTALGDVEVCPVCGTSCALVCPESMGLELESWKMIIRQDDDGRRLERLTKWLRFMVAQGKTGRSLFSVKYKYAATYGQQPDRALWDQAMRAAHARGSG